MPSESKGKPKRRGGQQDETHVSLVRLIEADPATGNRSVWYAGDHVGQLNKLYGRVYITAEHPLNNLKQNDKLIDNIIEDLIDYRTAPHVASQHMTKYQSTLATDLNKDILIGRFNDFCNNKTGNFEKLFVCDGQTHYRSKQRLKMNDPDDGKKVEKHVYIRYVDYSFTPVVVPP
jgi:hypothetical protein